LTWVVAWSAPPSLVAGATVGWHAANTAPVARPADNCRNVRRETEFIIFYPLLCLENMLGMDSVTEGQTKHPRGKLYNNL
jgi:hypothetical protein